MNCRFVSTVLAAGVSIGSFAQEYRVLSLKEEGSATIAIAEPAHRAFITDNGVTAELRPSEGLPPP